MFKYYVLFYFLFLVFISFNEVLYVFFVSCSIVCDRIYRYVMIYFGVLLMVFFIGRLVDVIGFIMFML